MVIFRGGSAQILSHLLSLKKNVSDKRKGQETIVKRVDVIIKESHSAMKRSWKSGYTNSEIKHFWIYQPTLQAVRYSLRYPWSPTDKQCKKDIQLVMQRVPKLSDIHLNAYSKCCKNFKVYLIIVVRYHYRVKRNITTLTSRVKPLDVSRKNPFKNNVQNTFTKYLQ